MIMSKPDNNNGAESGIALLMVIWILKIMIVIVMAFSLAVRTNAFSTLAYNEAVKRDFISEAGVQHAIMELLYRFQKVGRSTSAEVIEEDYWSIDGTVHTETLGDTEYYVRITDEGGKIDINKGNEILLRGLLSNMELEDEAADTIVDSILDWRDPDEDLVRLHGAENDYYMSLPRPYKAKNGDFDSLEELLLVKGMTSELLYGIEGKKKGLIDSLTVFSKDARVNIETAPEEVLRSIPGMSEESVTSIIEGRKGLDQQEKTPQGAESGPYITTGKSSNVFTIEVSARNGDKPSGYGTKAVVRIDSNKKYNILYWKGLAPVTSQ